MTDAEIDFLCVTYLDGICPDDETFRANSHLITDEDWRAMNEFADSLRKYVEQGNGPELSGASAE